MCMWAYHLYTWIVCYILKNVFFRSCPNHIVDCISHHSPSESLLNPIYYILIQSPLNPHWIRLTPHWIPLLSPLDRQNVRIKSRDKWKKNTRTSNIPIKYGCVWKWLVPHYPQWFCWSLSLLNGYFIGNIPNIFRHTHILNRPKSSQIPMVFPMVFPMSHIFRWFLETPWAVKVLLLGAGEVQDLQVQGLEASSTRNFRKYRDALSGYRYDITLYIYIYDMYVYIYIKCGKSTIYGWYWIMFVLKPHL